MSEGRCTSLRCQKEGMRRNPGQPFLYPLEQCKRACAEGSPLCGICKKQEGDPEKWHGTTTNAQLPPYSRGYFPEGNPLGRTNRSQYNLETTAKALEKAEKEALKQAKVAEKAEKAALKETEKAAKAAGKASNLAARMAAAGGGGGAESLWLPPSQVMSNTRATRRGGLVPYYPPLRGKLAKIWPKRRTARKRKTNSGSEYSNSNVKVY